MGQFLTYKNEVGHDQAIVAVACFPNLHQAKEHLEAGGLDNLSIAALETIKRNKGEEIEKIRREMAGEFERSLTGEMLSESRFITQVIELGVRRTYERLRANTISDPARAIRDLSQIRTQGIDKRLALEGRPTSITESRSPEEVIRQLEAMGVAKKVDAETTAEDA